VSLIKADLAPKKRIRQPTSTPLSSIAANLFHLEQVFSNAAFTALKPSSQTQEPSSWRACAYARRITFWVLQRFCSKWNRFAAMPNCAQSGARLTQQLEVREAAIERPIQRSHVG
jgi:hypothetical protein